MQAMQNDPLRDMLAIDLSIEFRVQPAVASVGPTDQMILKAGCSPQCLVTLTPELKHHANLTHHEGE